MFADQQASGLLPLWNGLQMACVTQSPIAVGYTGRNGCRSYLFTGSEAGQPGCSASEPPAR